MIRIAVSKGRVAEQALRQFEAFGYTFTQAPKRQLWRQDDTGALELIYLKAQDVPVYVAKGVAELGIVGSDVLRESPMNLISLLDLQIGKCQMCLAGPAKLEPDQIPYLRLASKYPNTTAQYLKDQRQAGAVLPLQGSVELAPILGISDMIVDLVESGQTLKAHDLVVHKVLFEVSATLVANPQLYTLRQDKLKPLVAKWSTCLNERSSQNDPQSA